MKIKVYTTSYWFKKDLPYIIQQVSLSGAKPEIEVERIKLPDSVPTFVDNDGSTKISWDWLQQNIFESGYQAVCLHINRRERDRLGITHPDPAKKLGGNYHVDGDNVLDFVVIADKRVRAEGYTFTDFTRIFFHELAHGFDHWSFGFPNANVHHWDYDLKQIHNIFALYSYDRMSITRTLRMVLLEIIRRLWKKE